MNEMTFTRLRELSDPAHLPALRPQYAHRRPALGLGNLEPPPRMLLLYGSLRERSYSRLAVEESARLLRWFGCETRIFDPADLPLPDQVADDDHPAVDCPRVRFLDRDMVLAATASGALAAIVTATWTVQRGNGGKWWAAELRLRS